MILSPQSRNRCHKLALNGNSDSGCIDVVNRANGMVKIKKGDKRKTVFFQENPIKNTEIQKIARGAIIAVGFERMARTKNSNEAK
jgi:hypothetical protein